MRVIINGIGVAGPALAFWLRRCNHEVTLVEQAPQLRRGGYVIDFWGLGYDIVERMGLIDAVRALGYQVRQVRIVDGEGKQKGGFDTRVFGRLTNNRFTSVRRSDISGTIYRAVAGEVETILGDSIAAIEDRGDRLHVAFEHAPARDADLVVGADGLHSRVRRIAFGADAGEEFPLGYHVAAFESTGYRPREELTFVGHSLPGRQISRFSLRDDRTLFLFVFEDQFLAAGEDPVTALRRIFRDAEWEWPGIERELERATDLYFDTVSQVRLPHWSRGRVALVGDAAACVSLMAGEGTGLAIAESYVLAGELHEAGGDLARGLARYEERLMPFLRRKQASAAKFASSFAPATSLGIRARNLVTNLLGIPFVADLAIGRSMRDDIVLPEYSMTRR